MTEPRAQERANDLWSVIQERSSVRAFEASPIVTEPIRRAIEAAGWAPSPHGTQPWRFAIVESRAERFRLADAMARTWREQLHLDGQDEDTVERRLLRSKERLERAPLLVVMCLYLGDSDTYPDRDRQDAETIMAIQSLGAAAQNFLLAIHAQGLDAGWMCAPLFAPDVVRSALDLGADLEPQALFPVGRAAAPPRRRQRRNVDELIVRWR